MRKGLGFLAFFGGVALAIYYVISRTTFTDNAGQVFSYFRRFGLGALAVSDKVAGTISGNGADPYTQALYLIAEFEGFSAKRYPDAKGYSIGYGHFIKPGEPYDANYIMDESEGWELLKEDAATARDCVASSVTSELTPNQSAALISFAYNIGCGAFQSSTLLKKLNAGDYAGASAQFGVWIYSGKQVVQALVNRRGQEAELFNA